ncbi:MAG: hypothetical protein J2P27_14605 [Actinobacteria bacterium]|nr:hypothetical protein [Actinomycetota bacterium]
MREGRSDAKRRGSGTAADPERQLPDLGKSLITSPRRTTGVLWHAGFTLLCDVAHANLDGTAGLSSTTIFTSLPGVFPEISSGKVQKR